MKYLLIFPILVSICLTANAGLIVDTITGSNNRATMDADAGQTFTTGTLGVENLLSEIIILGDSGGSASGATVSAQLWIDTDQDFGTWDPGTLVATSTNSQVITATDVNFTFNFSNEALSDNIVYVLSFTDGIDSHVSFRSDVQNSPTALSDGALFSGGAQPFGGAYDAAIQVVTVPEPSAFALLAGLTGFAYIMLRRRG
jgi:hypothetical protein